MNKSLNDFYTKAKAPSVELVSVDVFDTLLYRTHVPEEMRFYEISEKFSQRLDQKYGISLSADDLFLQRLLSAKLAYRLTPKRKSVREADYQTIVHSILNTFRLDPCHYDDYADTEYRYEIDALYLNDEIAEFLYKFKHHMNKKIIAISDMYFNSQQIGKLVNEKTGELTLDNIYSSADFGITKASGHLFPAVGKLEDVGFDNWVHCGDNYKSDFVSPSNLGITSIYTPRNFGWRLRSKLHRKIFRIRKNLSYL